MASSVPSGFPWGEFQLRCNRNRVILDPLLDSLTLVGHYATPADLWTVLLLSHYLLNCSLGIALLNSYQPHACPVNTLAVWQYPPVAAPPGSAEYLAHQALVRLQHMGANAHIGAHGSGGGGRGVAGDPLTKVPADECDTH
jgi:hypothetical protein